MIFPLVPKDPPRQILDFLCDAALTTDVQGRIDYLNPSAEALCGWSRADALGASADEVLRLFSRKTGDLLDGPVRKVLSEARTLPLPRHTALAPRRGPQVPVEGNVAPFYSGDGHLRGALIVLHDVSQARQTADRLAYLASHDSLTGLLNRREFERRVARALKRAQELNVTHALAYLDLDGFKFVNDACGHAAGDELLRRLAALLESRIRHRDTLARLGGDEFGLLLENCPVDQAAIIANELLVAVKNFHFEWEGGSFSVGVSIGLAQVGAESGDVAALLGAVDAACYDAKESGRSQVRIHTPDVPDRREEQRDAQMVTRIHRALADDCFRLHYQPVVPLQGAPGEYGEILVRMVVSDDLALPARFVPAAERHSLMPALDRWVIRESFAHLGRFPRRADGPVMWMINVSASSLSSPGFADFVREQAASNKVAAGSVCFEIPEASMTGRAKRFGDFLWGLKTDGFRFAVDGFGSGTATFHAFRGLPVDFAKLDGELIRDAVHDSTSLAIVESLHRIAKAFGFATVAKRVESRAILDKMQALGIDYAQGFALSRPIPLETLLEAAGSPGGSAARSPG